MTFAPVYAKAAPQLRTQKFEEPPHKATDVVEVVFPGFELS